jgi:hypothetical protein
MSRKKFFLDRKSRRFSRSSPLSDEPLDSWEGVGFAFLGVFIFGW